MSIEDTNKTTVDEEYPTDNLTDGMPKEPSFDGTTEENVEASANLADELSLLKDTHLRLMAEYDNYRKRTMKEKADLIKNGGEKVLVGLLPVVDDFQRALETIDKATDPEAVKEGIELIYNKFISFLQQNGVKTIEALGEPFDADFHEAIATIPAMDEKQKGNVIDNIQTGYMLNDKVIRHAKVVVAN